MKLRDFCRRLDLTGEDISQLEELERQLPLIAQLTGDDIFIDCFDNQGRTALVAAQAAPDRSRVSAYGKDVRGKMALREMEPAVYQAMESGLPTRELKAITQEGVAVRQDATPIRNKDQRIIGVLIREKDVYGEIIRRRQFERLARERDEENLRNLDIRTDAGQNDLRMREMHHRIKNNLQMIASIMNLQARRTDNAEAKLAFAENTQRVLSIAAIHDMLCREGESGSISLNLLLDRICRDIYLVSGGEKPVDITVDGEEIFVQPDVATGIALVASELVSNALRHGFPEGRSGSVQILLRNGPVFATVTVKDDGVGYDVEKGRSGSLGLDIVRLTVRDKLRGDVQIASGKDGTTVSFTFRSAHP